jgi:hypothetical protein
MPWLSLPVIHQSLRHSPNSNRLCPIVSDDFPVLHSNFARVIAC